MSRGNPSLSGAITVFQFAVWITIIDVPIITKYSLTIHCAKIEKIIEQ